MELWTEKHKPKTIGEIVGQKKVIEEVLSYTDSLKREKALLLTGPSGVGKNLILETIARERKYLLIQLDASDERSRDKIEKVVDSSKTRSLFHSGKLILIDEVDGISGRDRGAISSIINLIRKSPYPVFLIANDPWKPKLRPLMSYCKIVKLSRIPAPSIKKRLREICERENIRCPDDVLSSLARWSQGDMRSAITDLQNVALGKRELKDEDLEVLGFRERENTIFNIMPTIYFSKSITACKKAIGSLTIDPDLVFRWVEYNLSLIHI